MIRVGMIVLLWSFLAVLAVAEDRALVVGIEQYNDTTIKPARGSERDADDVEQLLIRQLSFSPSSIRKLTGARATWQEITLEFQRWLINGTRPGDRVFFYYAGHGSYLRDNDGDEEDGYDETIVPYDALRKGQGMIRDDQFARWIVELPGRRIVMVFDSCHSGTISRWFGRSGEKDETARYIIPHESELRERGRNRLLLEVSDGKIGELGSISAQSDTLIISAAGAMQTAHSMTVNGQWHGALTYALIEAYGSGNGNSSQIGQLKGALKNRIAGWQKDKRLNGNQAPEFELSSKRLEAEPIFGSWERVPQVALVNPHSKLRITLRASEAGKRTNPEGNLVYYENETISYQITTDAPGFLYLLAFSQHPTTGERYVTMLFPNKDENLDNQIKPPGIRLPEKSEYIISPTGLDVTVALVTTQKLKFEIKERYTWDEIFTVLNLKELQKEVYNRTRSISAKPRIFDWQAASLPIFTTKKL
jgi:Caspase domain